MDIKKVKRKRNAVKVKLSNDEANTSVRNVDLDTEMAKNEADLYKQAGNPLGDPNRR